MKNECERIFSLIFDKCIVIFNGIDFEEFVIMLFDWDFRRRYVLDSEKIIFFIGRYVYEKGIYILIEVFRKVFDNFLDVKFIIVGNGLMIGEFYFKVYFLGFLYKVLFIGFVSDEERKKFFKIVDIVVFLSFYEFFGIVVLEVMVLGCSIVVFDIGGFFEIVKYFYNGFIFYCVNLNLFVDMILFFLKDDFFC